MKVILINPPSDCVKEDRLEPPLGLLYIASIIRSEGFNVQIYDMTGNKNAQQIKNVTNSIPVGDIYGITTYCTNYYFVRSCIRHIREINRTAFIILGGPNPTALPDYTIEDSKCDCVITGEGEDAFLNNVRLIQDNRIPEKIVKGIGREDINTYLMPAWDLVDLRTYNRMLYGQKVVCVLSSRGCKHKCIYCNSIIMGGGTRKVRFRSAENVKSELEYLKGLGFNNFRFNDDNFTQNPKLLDLLKKIEQLKIKFRIFAHIEDLTEENCAALNKAGCVHVTIGLESLNPENLKALGKYSQHGKEEKNLSNARKHGLIVRSSFMVGLPYDSDENIEKYFKVAANLPLDEFTVYPLLPYPGTQLCEHPERWGYEIADHDFTKYIQLGKNETFSCALRHKLFSEKDVHRWVIRAREIFKSAAVKTPLQNNIAI